MVICSSLNLPIGAWQMLEVYLLFISLLLQVIGETKCMIQFK